MPKPKYKLSDYNRRNLYWKLVDEVCFPIRTKSDCKKLSDLIILKKLPPVSENTLCRLFLIENSNVDPYTHTLDTLALFCGFTNWFKLEDYFNHIANFEFSFGKLNPGIKNSKSLMKTCIHRNELKSLYNYTEQFDASLAFEKKLILAAEFYNSLIDNPYQNISFYKNFSHLPIIRESFYEIFVDPNFKIKDYELGMQYYLKNIKSHKEEQYVQDFIFGNSLLLRYYFLNHKTAQAKKTAQLLYETTDFSSKEINNIHVFPKTRYYAYKLFYFEINSSINSFKRHEEWLIDFAKKSIEKYNLLEQRIIFYTIADAFCYSSFSTFENRNKLKQVFIKLFDLFPEYVFKKQLQDVLPHFEQNASNRWRY
jgi:hypothetical protein